MSTTDITPFDFRGQQVCTITGRDGQPWFVAADVCAALSITNVADATSRLSDDERGVGTADTLGGPQQFTIVSEPGVYRLVFTSRRREADAFRSWLAHDVIPEIRRTGTYTAPAAEPSPRELHAAWGAALDRAEAAETRVAELEPAARFAEDFLLEKADLSLDDAAGWLQRAGVKTGPVILFQQMRTLGWVHRSREDGRWRVSAPAARVPWLVEQRTGRSFMRGDVLTMAGPTVRVTPAGVRRLAEVLVVAGLDLAEVGR